MNLHQMKYGMTQNLCVLDIAEKKLGKKKKLRAVKPYISDEAYKLAEEKSNAKKTGKTEEYKRLRREVRAGIRKDIRQNGLNMSVLRSQRQIWKGSLRNFLIK